MSHIEHVRLLAGHTTPETAYVVDDYPHGFRLRCKIRFWVETAGKGAKKGQQRFVSQTTNPRAAVTTWNAPKPGTYAPMVFMYLDAEQRVQWTSASESMWPVGNARLRFMGIYVQLTDAERARYDMLRLFSQRLSPNVWREWGELVQTVAEHRRDGGLIDLENGVWATPAGRLHYLGENLPVYLAAADELLTAG